MRAALQLLLSREGIEAEKMRVIVCRTMSLKARGIGAATGVPLEGCQELSLEEAAFMDRSKKFWYLARTFSIGGDSQAYHNHAKAGVFGSFTDLHGSSKRRVVYWRDYSRCGRSVVSSSCYG